MDREALRKLQLRWMLSWILIPVGFILTYYAVKIGFVEVDLIFTILLVWTVVRLIRLRKFITGKIRLYKPDQSLWFYRMSLDQQRGFLTAGQWLSVFAFFFLWIGVGSFLVAVIMMIMGMSNYTIKKRRMKAHLEVDEASLYRLYDLRIIPTQEHITALYKDFSYWTELPEQSNVMALTADRLIIARLVSGRMAERYELPLREIAGIAEINVLFIGKVVAIKMTNHAVIRFALKGRSNEDSPEVFLSTLVDLLDHPPLFERPNPVELYEPHTEDVSPLDSPPREQPLDPSLDLPASTQSGEPVEPEIADPPRPQQPIEVEGEAPSKDSNTKPLEGPRRWLDF
ncbi:hypothetical protein [Paenibacillus sp. J53TS2]|uniref:hypothetical protein n=1 Tax=Paenibacillus sp. J53TS2 TaxID=2807197 RepID=UPI001BCF9B28|nr:hypothetical protein [Paenibacillus sp. J53TS2]